MHVRETVDDHRSLWQVVFKSSPRCAVSLTSAACSQGCLRLQSLPTFPPFKRVFLFGRSNPGAYGSQGRDLAPAVIAEEVERGNGDVELTADHLTHSSGDMSPSPGLISRKSQIRNISLSFSFCS